MEQALKIQISEKYSEGMLKLLEDMAKEVENKQKDGIAHKLAGHTGELVDVFNFLKNEGYDIKYNKFETFYKDAREIINADEEFFMNALNESMSEELNEDDLEQVAGGGWFKNNWKKLLMGIGIAIAVVGLCIITGGLGGAAIMAGVAGSAAMSVTGAMTAAAGIYTAAIVTGAVMAVGGGAAALAGGLSK